MKECNSCIHYSKDKTIPPHCNIDREEWYKGGAESCPEYVDEQAAKDDAKYWGYERY